MAAYTLTSGRSGNLKKDRLRRALQDLAIAVLPGISFVACLPGLRTTNELKVQQGSLKLVPKKRILMFEKNIDVIRAADYPKRIIHGNMLQTLRIVRRAREDFRVSVLDLDLCRSMSSEDIEDLESLLQARVTRGPFCLRVTTCLRHPSGRVDKTKDLRDLLAGACHILHHTNVTYRGGSNSVGGPPMKIDQWILRRKRG